MTCPEEFDRLLEIYNTYPIHELTVHPRVRSEFYKASVHIDAFEKALRNSKNPICYNGDVATADDYRGLTAAFPELERMMIGRGLIADPALAEKLQGKFCLDKQRLKKFHDELYEGYCTAFESRRNAMMRMKEYWFYHILLFADSKKHGKKIKKAADPTEYESAVNAVFRELELLPEAIAEWKEGSIG